MKNVEELQNALMAYVKKCRRKQEGEGKYVLKYLKNITKMGGKMAKTAQYLDVPAQEICFF